jgi:membrane-bound lytic murein transglycosylase F
LGHLEDARVLAQKQGKNPSLWADVSQTLPLLSKQKWFSQTRYGYARGGEPVRYVENIRRYQSVLQHIDEQALPSIESDEETELQTPAAL